MRCKDCGEEKLLTKHSEIGSHIPPFTMLCEECHHKRHGIRLKKKIPGKYTKGTKRVHKNQKGGKNGKRK